MPTDLELEPAEILEPDANNAIRPSQSTPMSGNRLPPLTVSNANKMIQFFQENPRFLANKYTSQAANNMLAASTKIVGMSIQLERVNNQTAAAKAQNEFASAKIKGLSEVSQYVPVDDVEGQTELGRLNGMVGTPDFNLTDFANGVSRLQSKYKAKPEFQSSPGKELADRMSLEKQFGAESPQVKKFDELTAQSASPTNLGKLLAERRAAPESEKGYYDQAIGHLGQKMGISIQYDDQGRPIINYGPQKTSIGDPSVATQSMAQRKLLKYEAASELINDLQNKMQSGDVGIAGVLGEYVGDRLLPQLGVDTFKGRRADVRSTLIATRESLMKEINDDTRFSNIDRAEINAALPSSGVFESLPNALQKLDTVRRILNARGKIYGEGIGLPQPEWTLTPDEIKALYDKHQATGGKEGLSLEKARSLLERFHNFKP